MERTSAPTSGPVDSRETQSSGTIADPLWATDIEIAWPAGVERHPAVLDRVAQHMGDRVCSLSVDHAGVQLTCVLDEVERPAAQTRCEALAGDVLQLLGLDGSALDRCEVISLPALDGSDAQSAGWTARLTLVPAPDRTSHF